MIEPRKMKNIPDGRAVWINVRMFNTQIVVGREESQFYDDAW